MKDCPGDLTLGRRLQQFYYNQDWFQAILCEAIVEVFACH